MLTKTSHFTSFTVENRQLFILNDVKMRNIKSKYLCKWFQSWCKSTFIEKYYVSLIFYFYSKSFKIISYFITNSRKGIWHIYDYHYI
jgi:hypothetical protein